MKHGLSASCALALVFAASPGRATPPGSWAAHGHDFQRTSHGDGVGDMHSPTVAWTLPLGGRLSPAQALVADLDSDGRPETIAVTGGRVIVHHPDGTKFWTTGLVSPTAPTLTGSGTSVGVAVSAS